MSDSISTQDLNDQIDAAENRLAQLQELKAQRASMVPEKRLAIDLHAALCDDHGYDSNCDWNHESKVNADNTDALWESEDHKKFMDKATQMLAITDYDTALAVAKYAEGVA